MDLRFIFQEIKFMLFLPDVPAQQGYTAGFFMLLNDIQKSLKDVLSWNWIDKKREGKSQ